MIIFSLTEELMKLDAFALRCLFLFDLASIIRRVVLILNFYLLIDAPDELLLHAEYLGSEAGGEGAAIEVDTVGIDLVLVLDGGDFVFLGGGLMGGQF